MYRYFTGGDEVLRDTSAKRNALNPAESVTKP
jgi:hypothetical protein